MTQEEIERIAGLLALPEGKRTHAQNRELGDLILRLYPGTRFPEVNLGSPEEHNSTWPGELSLPMRRTLEPGSEWFTPLPLATTITDSTFVATQRIRLVNLGLRWNLAQLLGWVYQVDQDETEDSDGVTYHSMALGGSGMISYPSNAQEEVPPEEVIQANLVNSFPAWESSPSALRALFTWLNASDSLRVHVSPAIVALPKVTYPLAQQSLYLELSMFGQGVTLDIMNVVVEGKSIQYQGALQSYPMDHPRPPLLMAIVSSLSQGFKTLIKTIDPDITKEQNLEMWLRAIREIPPAYMGDKEILEMPCFCGSGKQVENCSCMNHGQLVTGPELFDLSRRLESQVGT